MGDDGKCAPFAYFSDSYVSQNCVSSGICTYLEARKYRDRRIGRPLVYGLWVEYRQSTRAGAACSSPGDGLAAEGSWPGPASRPCQDTQARASADHARGHSTAHVVGMGPDCQTDELLRGPGSSGRSQCWSSINMAREPIPAETIDVAHGPRPAPHITARRTGTWRISRKSRCASTIAFS